MLAVLVVAAAAALQPCDTESARCPRYPCPAPPPDYNERCVPSPNPLVINADGLCCSQFPCGDWACPTACGGDGAGSFDERGCAPCAPPFRHSTQ
eukprot:5141177-Prymnesium_polylepis.2